MLVLTFEDNEDDRYLRIYLIVLFMKRRSQDEDIVYNGFAKSTSVWYRTKRKKISK